MPKQKELDEIISCIKSDLEYNRNKNKTDCSHELGTILKICIGIPDKAYLEIVAGETITGLQGMLSSKTKKTILFKKTPECTKYIHKLWKSKNGVKELILLKQYAEKLRTKDSNFLNWPTDKQKINCKKTEMKDDKEDDYYS